MGSNKSSSLQNRSMKLYDILEVRLEVRRNKFYVTNTDHHMTMHGKKYEGDVALLPIGNENIGKNFKITITMLFMNFINKINITCNQVVDRSICLRVFIIAKLSIFISANNISVMKIQAYGTTNLQ